MKGENYALAFPKDVDSELEALYRRCIDKEPRNRPDFREILSMLNDRVVKNQS